MKKVIRLTESDLTRIVKRVLSEQTPTTGGAAAPTTTGGATGERTYDIKDLVKYPGTWNTKDIAQLIQKGYVKPIGDIKLDLDKPTPPPASEWCPKLGKHNNPTRTYLVAAPKDESMSFSPFVYYCDAGNNILMPKPIYTKIQAYDIGQKAGKDFNVYLGKLKG
jgi:hypothetical protein